MTLLVDTSALYALLDRADPNHRRATVFWATLPHDELPVTHNYVLVETCALVQRRLGVDAVRTLVDELMQPISILYVDEELHRVAVATVIAVRLPDVSLVDRVSFEVMRRLGLKTAFAFDAHFDRLGFKAVPNDQAA